MKKRNYIKRRGYYDSPRSKGITPFGPLPEVSKVYHAFHDGKCRRIRHLMVTVTEVLLVHDFRAKYPEDYKECKDIMKSSTWIWGNKPYSDYFVIVKINDTNECEFVSYEREVLMRLPGTLEWTNNIQLDTYGKGYESLLKKENLNN